MPAPRFGLDHLVVLVDDLDAAGAVYARLGFTVAPEMRHPFGTANRLVMFENNFLELVGIANRSELTGPGVLIAERLAAVGPGAYGIALNATDIERDRALLGERQLAPGVIGHGGRKVPMPDGTEGEARFSTALIPSPGLPFLFFLAQQQVPEVVWIPAWQRHPNGAAALAAVRIEVQDLVAARRFLATLYGAEKISAAPGGFKVATPLGCFEIVSSGERPPAIRCATIDVGDPGLIANLAAAARIPVRRTADGRLIVGAEHACGIALEFRETK